MHTKVYCTSPRSLGSARPCRSMATHSCGPSKNTPKNVANCSPFVRQMQGMIRRVASPGCPHGLMFLTFGERGAIASRWAAKPRSTWCCGLSIWLGVNYLVYKGRAALVPTQSQTHHPAPAGKHARIRDVIRTRAGFRMIPPSWVRRSAFRLCVALGFWQRSLVGRELP